MEGAFFRECNAQYVQYTVLHVHPTSPPSSPYQVRINYSDVLWPRQGRRTRLLQQYLFQCRCSRCEDRQWHEHLLACPAQRGRQGLSLSLSLRILQFYLPLSLVAQ